MNMHMNINPNMNPNMMIMNINQNINPNNSNDRSQLQSLSQNQNQNQEAPDENLFLENPIQIITKNLTNKGWLISEGDNIRGVFNSIDLLNFLNLEIKNQRNINNQIIIDIETDIYFKSDVLCESLKEIIPKLLEFENLRKMKNLEPSNPRGSSSFTTSMTTTKQQQLPYSGNVAVAPNQILKPKLKYDDMMIMNNNSGEFPYEQSYSLPSQQMQMNNSFLMKDNNLFNYNNTNQLLINSDNYGDDNSSAFKNKSSSNVLNTSNVVSNSQINKKVKNYF